MDVGTLQFSCMVVVRMTIPTSLLVFLFALESHTLLVLSLIGAMI